jgi:hypothetical protein
LDGVTLIMNGTRGAGQIVYLIDFEMYGLCYIMPHDLETVVREQMTYILTRSGEEVVEAENLVALREEELTKV